MEYWAFIGWEDVNLLVNEPLYGAVDLCFCSLEPVFLHFLYTHLFCLLPFCFCLQKFYYLRGKTMFSDQFSCDFWSENRLVINNLIFFPSFYTFLLRSDRQTLHLWWPESSCIFIFKVPTVVLFYILMCPLWLQILLWFLIRKQIWQTNPSPLVAWVLLYFYF